MIIYALALVAATQDSYDYPTPVPPAPPPPPINTPPPPPKGKASPPIPKNYPVRWVSTDDYPTSSLRQEEQGTSAFLLSIGTNGLVTRCTITSSSGWPALDEATCSNITRRARFYPAQDARGRSIASTYANRVSWRIPDDSYPEMPMSYDSALADYPSPPRPTSYSPYPTEADQPAGVDWESAKNVVKLSLDVDASGSISLCGIGESSNDAALDKASCSYATSNWRYDPAKDYDGNPTRGRVERYLYWPAKVTAVSPVPVAPPEPRIGRNPFLDTGAANVIISIDATGKITGCDADVQGLKAMIGQEKVGAKEICALAMNSRQLLEPFKDASGNPEARTVVIAFTLNHKPFVQSPTAR